MNFRIKTAGEIINKLGVSEVLDIGCRGCEAKSVLPDSVSYYGNDLIQNSSNSVTYVGDALDYDFGKTFECVVALDIVEHVDDPYTLIDKLMGLTDKYLIISLPNVYDIIHKLQFLTKSSLGSKYVFKVENQLDRHRWLMNYDEINNFYTHYASKHDAKLETQDIHIREFITNTGTRLIVDFILPVLGKKNLTSTVVGIFTKPAH